MVLFPLIAAAKSGEPPSLSTWSILGPLSMSALTQSTLPFQHADQSGVRPLLFATLSFAFDSIRSFAMSVCPLIDATLSGVHPLSLGLLGSPPRSRRTLTISREPFRAALYRAWRPAAWALTQFKSAP